MKIFVENRALFYYEKNKVYSKETRIIGRMSKNWLIKGAMRLRSIYWQMAAIWIV